MESNTLQIQPNDRVGLKVRNLTVRVKGKSNASGDAEKATESVGQKTILDDVSFELGSGQMLAIMGGSGSGKTTLLNTLSQRVNVTNKKLQFEGHIEYTRENPTDHISHAYLLQTDVFLPGLTLEETLATQASLRLPQSTTSEARQELVDSLLSVLELEPIRNERIASFSSHSTNLSGGEQRRVSLAIQLLSKPAILFLDEPTTGLDTSTSLKLVRVLKKLASPQFGITVVLSIHQPRPEISMLFDKFCLLTRGGRMVYYGNLVDTGAYFNGLKFVDPVQKNLSSASFIEYIIDLSIKDSSSHTSETATNARIDRLVAHWKVHAHQQPLEMSQKDQAREFVHNVKCFAPAERLSLWAETWVLTKRTFILTYRDTSSLLALNIGSALLAVATGWMFYKPKPDLAGIRSLTSTLYVMMEVIGFCPMFFEIERLWSVDGMFFYREYQENYVSIPGWLLSRRLGKLLLEDLPVPVIYACITYFMWGLRTENPQGERDLSYFGIYVALTILTNFVGMASAIFVFAISPDFSISALVFNGFYQLQNSACGYFVNAASMPVYVRWTKYIAYFWYAFGALTANQFTGWVGACPYDDESRCLEYTGNYNLEVLGFPRGWVGEPIGILVCWLVGFYLMSGVALKLLRYDVSVGKVIKNKWEGEEKSHETEVDDKEGRMLTNSTTEVNQDDGCKKDSVAVARAQPQPITVNLNSLTLAVALTKWGRKTGEKTLLDDISASFAPNRVNVIMGPSGSGKTTLLNYISNRLPRSSTYVANGTIDFNGTQTVSRQELGMVSAYVTQHDNTLIANLTVRETLYYQAKLRLPPGHSHHEIPSIVARLIRQIGLSDCADTVVGSEFVKGISGGEKRRVSIAIQLLSKPKLLFLDEPTSGLDSTNAIKILKLLADLSVQNHTTIILTIHQPQQEMFYTFGSLLLLAKGGHVVYNGDTDDVPQYLKSIGHEAPPHINVADHMLDLISNSEDEHPHVTRARIDSMIASWKHRPGAAHNVSYVRSATPAIEIDRYKFVRQPLGVTFKTIVTRQFVNAFRSKDVIISRAGQTIFLTIVHTLFFAPLRNNKDGIDNRLGLIQEALNLNYAGLINNITIYPFERDIFYQEYKDGIYGVLTFSGSYLVNELPTEVLPTLLFSILIVFGVGLPRNAGMFFGMFATCFVSISCGESLGIMVNSCFNHLGVATNILTNVVILAIFMGGTMSINMPPFFKGINYISPMKYGVGICAKLGFAGQKFDCGLAECSLGTGKEVLQNYNLDINLGGYFGGLIACLVVYRALALISVWVRVKYFN